MNAISQGISSGPRAGQLQHDRPYRVGTRASPLALVQTRSVIRLLSTAHPGEDLFQEHHFTTTGDAVQDRRLADIGGKGLFAKEIHEALLDRRIDFAVHSLKDLETELPPGIVLGCTLKREDPRDVLILGNRCGTPDPVDPFAALPEGAVVGTSSVRRQAQLMHVRPDLQVTTIRGNVQTRLAKLHDGQYDASLLALAGLHRLGARHHRHHRAGRRQSSARVAAGDRGSRSPRRRHRGTVDAGGAGRIVPDADRRLCSGHGGWAADADRHGSARGWVVSAHAEQVCAAVGC